VEWAGTRTSQTLLIRYRGGKGGTGQQGERGEDGKHEIPRTNDQSWKVRGKPSTKGMPGGNGAAGGDGGAPSSFGRSHILATEGKIRVTPQQVEVSLSFGLGTDGFGVAGK